MTGASLSTIAANLERVRERVARACERANRSPAEVTLIAVTKTWPAVAVAEALDAGVTDIGENRVQEALAKAAELEAFTPRPTWHLIGHLQTNKVRDAVRTFDTIHSADSERLLRAIDTAAAHPLDVFLEVNVAGEESKYGIDPREVANLIAIARDLPQVRLTGLMTVAPRASNPEEVRPVFRQLATLAREHGLPHLSMGMTEDFEIAIEEGATHIRVGRAIFGERA